MDKLIVVVRKCTETGVLVGYVPGVPGAHSQGNSLEELKENVSDVIEMLTESE